MKTKIQAGNVQLMKPKFHSISKKAVFYMTFMLAFLTSDSLFAQIWSRTWPRVYVSDRSDRVGIGTYVPGEKLDVMGDHYNSHIRLRSDHYDQGIKGVNTANLNFWASEPGVTWDGSGIGNNVVWKNAAGTWGPHLVNINKTGSFIRFVNQDTYFGTVNSSDAFAYNMIFNSSGNVGIGTTTPATKLHINGTVDTSPTSHGMLVVGPTSGANISMDQNEIMARNNGAVSKLYLNHEGGDVILSGLAGNVGIGTTSPSPDAKLDVAGTAKVNKLRLGNNWLLSGVGDGHSSTDDWLRLFNTSGTDYYGGFAAGRLWTRALYVATQIGADIANFSHSSDHGFLRVRTNNSLRHAGIDLQVNGKSNWMMANDGDKLFFQQWTNGIPVTPMEVYGDRVWVSKLCVSANQGECPDYVFEDNYKLKSIAELEKFVKDNKHLPNVPNAKEIAAAGGMDVQKMTFSLLEKVEELTLYTIKQDKQIEEQDKQIKEQDKQIKQLIEAVIEIKSKK